MISNDVENSEGIKFHSFIGVEVSRKCFPENYTIIPSSFRILEPMIVTGFANGDNNGVWYVLDPGFKGKT